MSNTKNQALQLLRILACVAVFVVHFGQRMEFSGLLGAVTEYGKYGTRLFFLLSGYLAAKSILGKPAFNVKEYYIKRAIRILPLYYAVILFFFLTETFIWRVIPEDSLKLGWSRYVFLLNGIVGSDERFWSNLGATWTIPVFCFFYLVIPWMMKLIKDLRSAAVAFAASAVVSVLCLKYCNGNLLAVRKMSIFFLGIMIYMLDTKKDKRIFTGVAVLTIIVMAITGAEIAYIIVLLLALLLLAMKDADIYFSEKWAKIIDILDEHSYTLYLAQGIIFCGFVDKLWIPMKYRAAVILLTTVLLTYLMHRFVEKPAQRVLTRKLLKK